MEPTAGSSVDGPACPWPGGPRAGVVQPVPVDPSGERGPTPNQSRGPKWRRTSRGLFVPAATSRSPEQRILEASMVLTRTASVTGWAALRWRGATWFSGIDSNGTELDVPLLTADHSIRSQPGFRVIEERNSFSTLNVLDGVPCVDATHATAYAMRYAASEREAGVVFEMAAFNDAVSTAEIAALLARMNGWTGVPRARQALPYLDENSWSPQETRLRLAWLLDARLPTVLTNRPVFDRYGNHLGTPDLLDEEAGLVVEYDGVHHLNRDQRLRDLDREARFRRAGLEYLAIATLRQPERGHLIRLLREARARARFAAPASRAWTTALPHWWTPLFTVEQRRALDADQRKRWLRTRRAA